MSENQNSDGSNPTWHAIVIGTDAYPGLPTARLQGCVNDATAIQHFLIDNVGIPPANLRLLTSPAGDAAVTSTAANIREAFQSLATNGAVKPGDHVVLFYACHGVRLTRKNADASTQIFYGFAAADLTQSVNGYANLILDRELNRFLRQMKQRGASVTVIADTCHSGASTRNLGQATAERLLREEDLKPLSDSDWQTLLQLHPALSAAEAGTRAVGESEVDRLVAGVAHDADFVVLAACQDLETAKETKEAVLAADGTATAVSHGALTLGLLQALKKIPPEHVKNLRWMDFYDDLSQAVSQRIAALTTSSQRPALEGNPARPVFGGKWRPFAPGFTVRSANGVYSVDGGILHGLDVGAQLALYPADTADFEAAAALAVRATIDTATLATSTIRLADAQTMVQDKSRARLTKPSPNSKPMLVRWRNVPEELKKAARLEDQAIASSVAIADLDMPAHLEVRPWTKDIPAGAWGNKNSARYWTGACAGWVLVRSDLAGTPSLLPDHFEPEPDDIIAYLPGAGPQLDSIADKYDFLGDALRNGLVHYAQYLRTRDRRSGDDTLRAMLDVKLRIGSVADAPLNNNQAQPADGLLAKTTYLSPEAGVYHLTEGQWLFIETKVLKPTALHLYVGVIGCSDDGNILAAWPPAGANYTFGLGSTTYIGHDRFNPLFLNHRPDQSISYWTLKLISYTAAAAGDPINIKSLEVQETVQDIFGKDLIEAIRSIAAGTRGSFGSARGSFGGPPAQAERPAWYTWELRIACHKPAETRPLPK